MHVLMVTVGGLTALVVFYFGATLMGRPRAKGAALFIPVWFLASILDGAVGVLRAGIPLVSEIGAFIPIFGIPAAAAWILAYRVGR